MKRVFLGAVAAALLSLGLAAPLHAADTIKIGIAGAHSGDLASYGVPSLNAAKVVVAKANAQGGVLGKQIELVIGDDQCKPELATNVATKLISDKVAVAEETVRLRSHFEELKNALDTDGAVGRRLDFIIQEMNREANTIGSKVSDAELAHRVVDIKVEIEKIREQIQNLE